MKHQNANDQPPMHNHFRVVAILVWLSNVVIVVPLIIFGVLALNGGLADTSLRENVRLGWQLLCVAFAGLANIVVLGAAFCGSWIRWWWIIVFANGGLIWLAIFAWAELSGFRESQYISPPESVFLFLWGALSLMTGLAEWRQRRNVAESKD